MYYLVFIVGIMLIGSWISNIVVGSVQNQVDNNVTQTKPVRNIVEVDSRNIKNNFYKKSQPQKEQHDVKRVFPTKSNVNIALKNDVEDTIVLLKKLSVTSDRKINTQTAKPTETKSKNTGTIKASKHDLKRQLITKEVPTDFSSQTAETIRTQYYDYTVNKVYDNYFDRYEDAEEKALLFKGARAVKDDFSNGYKIQFAINDNRSARDWGVPYSSMQGSVIGGYGE